MSEAPERIGLISDGFGNWALAHRDEVDTAVHYIRADLAPSPAPDVRGAQSSAATAMCEAVRRRDMEAACDALARFDAGTAIPKDWVPADWDE